jgi:hypothetical protein
MNGELMTPEQFRDLIVPITDRIQGKPFDTKLEAELNAAYPAGGPAFKSIFEACNRAIAAGWMCNREAGGIRFGRVIKPGPGTQGFSVDVVDMKDIKGPHHRHPHGEIDMVMPLTPAAKFDGRGAGWLVYGADSAHSPTVSDGRALVLYLLPQGAIEFTK